MNVDGVVGGRKEEGVQERYLGVDQIIESRQGHTGRGGASQSNPVSPYDQLTAQGIRITTRPTAAGKPSDQRYLRPIVVTHRRTISLAEIRRGDGPAWGIAACHGRRGCGMWGRTVCVCCRSHSIVMSLPRPDGHWTVWDSKNLQNACLVIESGCAGRRVSIRAFCFQCGRGWTGHRRPLY